MKPTSRRKQDAKTDNHFPYRHPVTVIIDRLLGSTHPDFPKTRYPVNYGYIPGIPASDGEEQDAYVLGVTKPVKYFTGELIAVIHRKNDMEDKWVVVPFHTHWTLETIREQTAFIEQYFDTTVLML